MQAAQGDEQAFAALLRSWRLPLYQFLHRLSGSDDDAHELLQRTFIKVHQRLASIDEPGRFKPWLYQVAMNQFRDWYRSRQREQQGREALSLLDLESGAETASLPHEAMETADRNRLLQLALSRLSPEQREVLVLKTWQGLTFPEIAQALNIPENTAKSRLYYSYRMLAGIFDDMNLTFDDLWP